MSEYNKCPLCYIDITDKNFKKLSYCTCPMQIHPECYDILTDNNFKCHICYKEPYLVQLDKIIKNGMHNLWNNIMHTADKILKNPTYYTIPLYITYIIIVTILFAIPTIIFCWSKFIDRPEFNIYERFVFGMCAPIVILLYLIIIFGQ